MIQLAPTMPAMDTANFVWACLGDFTTQKIIFDLMVKTNEAAKMADRIISNSAYDLEPGAFSFAPTTVAQEAGDRRVTKDFLLRSPANHPPTSGYSLLKSFWIGIVGFSGNIWPDNPQE
jgi:hypothetical protein